MSVTAFVGTVGSFASVIGLSIQVFEKCKDKVGDNSEAERMGLFVALTDITKTWKKIHNHYHIFDQDVRRMSRSLSDGKDGIKTARDLSDADMTALFRSCPQISNSAPRFEATLESLFAEPRRIIATTNEIVADAVGDIRNSLGLDVSQKASQIHQAQINAIESHSHVCEFFNQVAPLVRRSSWNVEEKGRFLEVFERFPEDSSQVIQDCDLILLNTIDLFATISNDLM